MSATTGLPFVKAFRPEFFPIDKLDLGPDVLGTLSEVLITSYTEIDAPSSGEGFEIGLCVADEVVIDVIGLDSFSIVLGGVASSLITAGFSMWPNQWAVTIDAGARVRFPRTLLKPVVRQNDVWVDDVARPYAEVHVGAGVIIDQDWNVTFDGPNAFRLDAAMIAESGLVLEGEVALDFSETIGLPESAALGLPATWRGIVFRTLTVHLPESLKDSVPISSLVFNNFHIGSGGVNGGIALTGQPAAGVLAGFPFQPTSISIELRQNCLTNAAIEGTVTLPFFDAPVSVVVSLDLSGKLTVNLAATQPAGTTYQNGLVTLTRPNLLSLTLDSIGFEAQRGYFAVKLSGQITPLMGEPELSWPSFRVQELSIDSEGNVQLDGGWLVLPSTTVFDFHGFKMELSKIGFGTDEDGWRWLGLSGGIHLVEGMPIGGSVDGLKIKWKGTEVDLELRGIGVQMVVPNTLALDGRVEFIDDERVKGFLGAVKLTLIPTQVVVDAQLLIGRNSESSAYSFAYIFVAGELPAGIPLGSTGLSLYKLAGLAGYNVAPDKKAEEPWFGGWYMREPIGVTHVEKWEPRPESLAFGAGAMIGTSADNGFAFHGDFLLVLLLPGPILLIDGKSAFLSKRGGGDPPLVSLAVFDGRTGTLQFNVQGKYQYPKEASDLAPGALIDVTAFSEAYFDFHSPRNWHFYLGMDSPKEMRVRASLFQLFEANGYLMLTQSGVRLGAWYGYEGRWKYGPLKLALSAYAEGDAAMPWSLTQFEGQFGLHGNVALKAFGFGASLQLDSAIQARAPHPKNIHAEFKVKLKTPWPLPDPKAEIELIWEDDAPPPPLVDPLERVGLEHLKVSEKWLTAPTLDEAGAMAPVPLDARPVLCFSKNMIDETGLALNWLPPADEDVGPYRFRYSLTGLTLSKRRAGSSDWIPATQAAAASLPEGRMRATWLAVLATASGTSGAQGVPPMSKLMLWSRTPFDYGRETTGAAYEEGFLDANPDWPCAYDWSSLPWKSADFSNCAVGPMAGISAVDELVLVAVCGDVREWSGDWLTATRAVCIDPFSGQSPGPKSGWNPFEDSSSAYLADNDKAARLTIFLPAGTAAARLCVGQGTNGAYRLSCDNSKTGAYDTAWSELLSPQAEVLLQPSVMLGHDVRGIELRGTVRLLRIDWIDHSEFDRGLFGGGMRTRLREETPWRLGEDPELLEPVTTYRLNVSTVAARSCDGGSSWEKEAFNKTCYFRTTSPPGLEPGASSAGDESPVDIYPRGPLRDLRPYVLMTAPPDGACPFYRSYDIGIEFNESYVELMYMLNETPLALKVHDSNGQLVPTCPVGAALQLNEWKPAGGTLATQSMSSQEQAWIDRLTRLSCVDFGNAAPPIPAGLWVQHPGTLLQPGAVYRAKVVASVPSAFLPLDASGAVLMESADEARLVEVNGLPLKLIGGMTAHSNGHKLLVLGNSVVETAIGAAEASRPFDRTSAEQLRLLQEAVAKAALPPGKAVSVVDWSFVTSRFASFAHQIHSWSGNAIDVDANDSSLSGTLLDAVQMKQLEDLLVPFPLGVPAIADSVAADVSSQREAEVHAFERASSLFGLAAGRTPTRTCATLLRDDSQFYGVLLECPEPVLAERMTLRLLKHPTQTDSSTAPEAWVRIAGIGLAVDDAPSQLIDEYVDLILTESASLQGAKLQIRSATGDWVDYYTFPASLPLSEGSLVRVHTGSSAFDLSSDLEAEHHYVLDSGGTALRRLPPPPLACIRLLGADGLPLHERSILTGGFADQDFRVLRSRDGTRALIFLSNTATPVQSLASGTLRLRFAFLRDISQYKAGAPVLRRLGSESPELADMDITL